MTKECQHLTDTQRQLIVDHLDLVAQVLNKHICRDLSNPDLEWDDLYQTGCLALCKAALLHDNSKPFGPYAARSIRNALFDYCGKSLRYRQPLCMMDQLPEVPVYDESSFSFCDKDLTAFIKAQGSCTTGVIQKGLISLLKKSEGYTSTELSKEFGTTPNSVRAWMSLAAKKLRQEPELYKLLA